MLNLAPSPLKLAPGGSLNRSEKGFKMLAVASSGAQEPPSKHQGGRGYQGEARDSGNDSQPPGCGAMLHIHKTKPCYAHGRKAGAPRSRMHPHDCGAVSTLIQVRLRHLGGTGPCPPHPEVEPPAAPGHSIIYKNKYEKSSNSLVIMELI